MDSDRIARAELRHVFAQARLFDEIELVHDGTSIRQGWMRCAIIASGFGYSPVHTP
jgi:hypothetical protein